MYFSVKLRKSAKCKKTEDKNQLLFFLVFVLFYLSLCMIMNGFDVSLVQQAKWEEEEVFFKIYSL